MKFTPAQVDEMSLWQLTACIDGVNAASGAEEPDEAPSRDEFEDMVERLGTVH